MRLFTYAVVSAAITGALGGNWWLWVAMMIGATGYALIIWVEKKLEATA